MTVGLQGPGCLRTDSDGNKIAGIVYKGTMDDNDYKDQPAGRRVVVVNYALRQDSQM